MRQSAMDMHCNGSYGSKFTHTKTEMCKLATIPNKGILQK